MNFNAEPKIIQDILSLERVCCTKISKRIFLGRRTDPGILGGY